MTGPLKRVTKMLGGIDRIIVLHFGGGLRSSFDATSEKEEDLRRDFEANAFNEATRLARRHFQSREQVVRRRYLRCRVRSKADAFASEPLSCGHIARSMDSCRAGRQKTYHVDAHSAMSSLVARACRSAATAHRHAREKLLSAPARLSPCLAVAVEANQMKDNHFFLGIPNDLMNK